MRYFLFCLFFLCSICVYAQDDFKPIKDESAFQEKVTKIADITQTISSNFVQKKHLSFMEEDIESKGQFYFKKDNLLRWEYHEPFCYAIVINNNLLTIQDEGTVNEVNLSSNKMFQEINQIIQESLQGNVLNNSDRFKHQVLENEEYYLIKLNPTDKKMKAYLEEIELYFDKSDFVVSKIIMHELSKDYTELIFTDKKINHPIDDFIFSIE